MFDGCNFTNSDLSRAKFCNFDSQHGDFALNSHQRSKFIRCNFSKANLSQANIQMAEFIDCNFTDTDLTYAENYGASWKNCSGFENKGGIANFFRFWLS